MDPGTLFGLLIGILALALGQFLEGGHIGSLLQLAAGVIVVGGTLGATLVSVPLTDLRRALELLPLIFRRPKQVEASIIQRFYEMAVLSRKDGIVALEEVGGRARGDFLSRAVGHVVDGTSDAQLESMLERDVESRRAADLAAAKAFETAGGYAPTIGILGAVIGLIHAMESLAEPSDLGRGIAVAFVATIYGVGLANLVLLPIATRLRRLIQERSMLDEMVIEGTLALQAGHPPRAIEARLRSFLSHKPSEAPGR